MRGVTDANLHCSCTIFQPIIFSGTPSEFFEVASSILGVSRDRERGPRNDLICSHADDTIDFIISRSCRWCILNFDVIFLHISIFAS